MTSMVYGSNPVGPNTGLGQAAYMAALQAQYAAAQGGQGYSPFGYQYGQGGGSGGGGSGGVSPYDLPGQYQQAYNEAKLANEQRYNDILSQYMQRQENMTGIQSGQTDDVLNGYENRYQRGMNNLQGLGDQEKRDTSQRYTNLAAQNQQDLTSRGLTGTTILPTMRQGVAREESDALSRVNERLQRERLGYDASLSGDALSAQERMYGRQNEGYLGTSGDTLGFMERRSDTYPDFNQLAALGQQYGAGGGSGYMNGVPQYVTPQSLGYNLPGMGGMQGGFQNFVQPWWNGAGMVPMEFNGKAGVNGAGGPALDASGRPIDGMPLIDGMPGEGWIPPVEGGWSPGVPGESVYVPGRDAYKTDPTGGLIDPQLVQQYGQEPAQLVTAVTALLGHPPDSEEEFQIGLRLLQSQRPNGGGYTGYGGGYIV